MVKDFEEYTQPLNDDEFVMLDLFMAGIQLRTVANAIKSNEIIEKINVKLLERGIKLKLTEARLRKISNHIRVNSLLPLRGTTRGYYLATERHEIEAQIQSLRDRANAIEAAAKGLEFFLKPPPPPSQPAPLTLFDVADTTTTP